MDFKGTILSINSFEKGDFYKKEVIIEVPDGNYTNKYPVEFIKDKIELIAPYHEGDTVEIAANLKGREYNGKIYLSLEGWKVKGDAKPTIEEAQVVNEEDDLPF
ncbi:MAG: DUF3127 domain-containing protein [Lentimicrobiaceae bacterium]